MIVRSGDVFQYPDMGMEGFGSWLKKTAKKAMKVTKVVLPLWYVGAYAADKVLGTGVTKNDSPAPTPAVDAATQAAAANEAAIQQQAAETSSGAQSYTKSGIFSKSFALPIQNLPAPVTTAAAAAVPTVQPIQAGQYLIPPSLPLPVPGSGRPSWLVPAAVGALALGGLYLFTRSKN